MGLKEEILQGSRIRRVVGAEEEREMWPFHTNRIGGGGSPKKGRQRGLYREGRRKIPTVVTEGDKKRDLERARKRFEEKVSGKEEGEVQEVERRKGIEKGGGG